MTEPYANIRRALAMGPTPGPWSVRDYVVQGKSFDEGRLVPIAQPYGLRMDGSDLFANAALIAACDPDTIRELLAERDQLAAALEQAREDARVLRRGNERLAEALREAQPFIGWAGSYEELHAKIDALLREQEEGK